jgi:hypothetical protein
MVSVDDKTGERSAGRLKQRIVGYHQDDQDHWVGELECGHNQHLRHEPPWTVRPWVTTPDGRASHLGETLDCRKCDAGAAPDRAA